MSDNDNGLKVKHTKEGLKITHSDTGTTIYLYFDANNKTWTVHKPTGPVHFS